ncbi:hypothetical protein [Streptodolium elevatio]
MPPVYDPPTPSVPPPPGRPFPGGLRGGSSNRRPWLAVGGAALAATVLVTVLVTTGDEDAARDQRPIGASDGARVPGTSAGKATSGATSPSGRSGSPTTGASSNWDTAASDTDPFTPARWFGATGETTIQGRPYTHIAQDSRDCQAAEVGMRDLFGTDCIGIVRSLWTDVTKSYVGSVSVVSLTDEAAARSLADRLLAPGRNDVYVSFIQPPSDSGVRFSEQTRTWAGTITSGHYLVVIEVARADGQAPDEGSEQVYGDLERVPVRHIDSHTWNG